MDESTRKFVRARAHRRCEHCRLPESFGEARFHIEHIVALQHLPDQPDDPENLALACQRCNSFKGPNIASMDIATGHIVPLFHPRPDEWSAHLRWVGATLIGLIPAGRATVAALGINEPGRVEHRRLPQMSGIEF